MAHNGARPTRFSAQQKTEVVVRRLRGADMDLLSRELRAPAARLAAWRDAFLSAGQEARKQQPRDARARELARLREQLGESSRGHERWREKLPRVEPGRPLRRWRAS